MSGLPPARSLPASDLEGLRVAMHKYFGKTLFQSHKINCLHLFECGRQTGEDVSIEMQWSRENPWIIVREIPGLVTELIFELGMEEAATHYAMRLIDHALEAEWTFTE